MSTRVQKGSTVFRPVAKARHRPAECTSAQPSIVQDNRAPPETQPASALDDPTLSPQKSVDHVIAVPVVIANTAKQGVPIVVTPFSRSQRPAPIEGMVASASSSHTDGSIAEQTSHEDERRLQSESLATTSSKKGKRARRPATPAFDAHADPGEALDPTSVTMAALCEDTGQGRVSSKAVQILGNHLTWKKSNREKRAKMKMKMEAKKYGRNEDGDTGSRPESAQTLPADATPGPSSTELDSGTLVAAGDTLGQGFDYTQNISTSRYNVQVRIGPNGETVVDEESLFVDRNAEVDTTEYTHIEESDVTRFVNSATYSKRFRGSRWSTEETELFYNALSQFGENYELISYVLPGRDRKACKNKFKSEDKKNPQRINYCLKNSQPYDMQTLSRMTGKDFSGPTPEIRAPVVLSLGETESAPKNSHALAPRQTMSSSPTTIEHVEEVVGDISSFNPE